MARSKYKRKGKAKFLMIEGYIMRSPAWRALSPNDKAVYLELKWRYDGLNNGRIGLGEREVAAALRIGRDTARRSFISLMEKGFVVKAKASGFNVKNRVATEWRLTEYPCDVTGQPPTKDFTRWSAEKITGAPQVRTGAPQALSELSRGEKDLHRRIPRPVGSIPDESQAHLKATYSITTGGRANAV